MVSLYDAKAQWKNLAVSTENMDVKWQFGHINLRVISQ